MENLPAADAALAAAAADRPLVVPPRRRRGGQVAGSVASHAILILLCFFALAPLVQALSSAFKPKSEILTSVTLIPERPTLSHFAFVLGQTEFPTWLRNSLQIAVGTTLCALVVGTLGGYAMSRWRFRGRGLYGNTLLIVQMFPGVMLGIPLFLLLDDYGLIDTLWALLVTYLTLALAFSVWMLKGYFAGIPREIEEAALVDGLSIWGAFLTIVLPIALPGMVAAFILSLVLTWNEYFFAALLTSSHANTLPVMVASQTGSQGINWWSMAALSTAAILPLVVIGVVLERFIIKGMAAGAVK